MARENSKQDRRPPSAGALLRSTPCRPSHRSCADALRGCAAPLLEIQPDRADTILEPGFSRVERSLEGSLEVRLEA